MTQDTLTVLTQHATYLDGYLFINFITNEETVLDLIITSTKPTRKKNPAIQEPGMKTHRWLYSMKECHRIPDLVITPNTVHNYSFRFPEISDILYYTVLYKDLPDTTSPQAPIFALRVPLEPIYTQLWPGETPPPEWQTNDFPPDSTITVTPGRITQRNVESTFSNTEIGLIPYLSANPLPALTDPLFVLYDSTYKAINQEDASFYLLDFYFAPPDFSYIKRTLIYGDLNDDPCNLFPTGFLGNFQPHIAHLFCCDLYRIPLIDLCGNPLDSGTGTQFLFFHTLVANISITPTGQYSIVNIRPFAIFRMTGPLQDISGRWRYLRPLLPQGSTPNFTQRK